MSESSCSAQKRNHTVEETWVGMVRDSGDRANYHKIFDQYGFVIGEKGEVKRHKKITFISGGKEVEVKITGANTQTGIIRFKFFSSQGELVVVKGLAVGSSNNELCNIHALKIFLEKKEAKIE